MEQFLLYIGKVSRAEKSYITAANTECQSPAELNTQQWLLTEKVIQLLRVFEEATRGICQCINSHTNNQRRKERNF